MQNSSKYLPTRRSYKMIVFVILILFSIYLLDNFYSVLKIDYYTYSRFINPILWLVLILIYYKLPYIKPKSKLKQRSYLYFCAFNFSIIYVIINIFFGFLDGLGKSPYNHSFYGVITNLISIVCVLFGREFIRSYLINSLTKNENYLILITIALFMTVISFNFNKYTNINNVEDAVEFIAQYFAPELSHNIFASYLAYLGGPFASIIYLGLFQLFHWMSPVLPDLKWINAALIGTLCPIFFLMSLQSLYANHNKEIKKRRNENEDVVSWIITSIISIGVIWFAVGVFSIYPSVIITGSMEPAIKPGDVILVSKITDMEDIEKLQVNDVIQFQRDGVLISHRIIEIKNDSEKGIQFRTKGDNNPGADVDLVKPLNIKGTIKYIVPKVGLLTFLIKSNNEVSLKDIIF